MQPIDQKESSPPLRFEDTSISLHGSELKVHEALSEGILAGDTAHD